jgi:Flp pilus assembly protein TadG
VVQHRLRDAANDRGVSTLEAVITTPIVVLMILAIVQAGLYYYAQRLAASAAQEAARQARAYNSTADEGHARGATYLGQVDTGDVLHDPAFTITRTSRTVTVRVTGKVVSLVPFWTPTVSVQVQGPVEHYVPG